MDWIKLDRKGDLEFDELGKLILGLLLLIILIVIVTVIIKGDLSDQKDSLINIFSSFGN